MTFDLEFWPFTSFILWVFYYSCQSFIPNFITTALPLTSKKKKKERRKMQIQSFTQNIHEWQYEGIYWTYFSFFHSFNKADHNKTSCFRRKKKSSKSLILCCQFEYNAIKTRGMLGWSGNEKAIGINDLLTMKWICHNANDKYFMLLKFINYEGGLHLYATIPSYRILNLNL